MTVLTKHIKTPLGLMLAGTTDKGICMCDFPFRKSIDSIKMRIKTLLQTDFEEGDHQYFGLLQEQLDAYFKGTLQTFDLPLHLAGSPFQQQVWQALQQIPYGHTRSYKQQSVFLGNEKAIRAVAKANGENSIAIIVPCHRVIGEDGSLTGYAGGLSKKKWLLDHENRNSGATQQLALFSA